MKIKNRLASAQRDRMQEANKALASEILQSEDRDMLEELVKLLNDKDFKVQFDALKVLETIGDSQPELVENYFDRLLPLLKHQENKIVWMCMSAISHVAHFHQAEIYRNLSTILDIMDRGSVITRDKGFVILLTLYQNEKYSSSLFPLLSEQLLKAPDNQFGQYTEKWMQVIANDHVRATVEIIETRQRELTHPSHQKRAAKNLMTLRKFMG